MVVHSIYNYVTMVRKTHIVYHLHLAKDVRIKVGVKGVQFLGVVVNIEK